MHKAARGGHESATAALLKAGADVNARDSSSRTPLRMAENNGATLLLRDAGGVH